MFGQCPKENVIFKRCYLFPFSSVVIWVAHQLAEYVLTINWKCYWGVNCLWFGAPKICNTYLLSKALTLRAFRVLQTAKRMNFWKSSACLYISFIACPKEGGNKGGIKKQKHKAKIIDHIVVVDGRDSVEVVRQSDSLE